MENILSKSTRQEHDFLGTLAIPNENYYGIQTLRAVENFYITGQTMKEERDFIKALAWVKKAAAMTNQDCGVLSPEIAQAIIKASDLVAEGRYDDQFVTDLIQGGAGTSVNMNANEVIANLALELLGYPKGQYEKVHPNNHVNCSQSTNDVYPTAFRIALYFKIGNYLEILERLQRAFAKKAKEFEQVIKMGRTQLQDAVPMTLGQEFGGFATTLKEDMARLNEVRQFLLEINMGATAIGTKVNTPEGYAEKSVAHLAEISGLDLRLSPDLVEATSDTGAYVLCMGTIKRNAVKLSKICNDLRLLSSGPRTGLNEINLPARQPGSSIMPGKVNPVMPEVVNQACFYVIGQDLTVTLAAEAGQLQLNVMEPVLAYALFSSLNYLGRALDTFEKRCVSGITTNDQLNLERVMNSIGIVTQLNPVLGYETCSSVAREALDTGKSVHQIVVVERKLITEEKWAQIYSLENLIHPKIIK